MKQDNYEYMPETAYDDSEINLKELFSKLWKRRRFVFVVTAAFAAFGLVCAMLQRPVYRSTCSFVPEKSRSAASAASLSSLAAMAGINLGDMSSGTSLSPLIYPQLLENVSFNKELMRVPLHFKKHNEAVCLYDYWTDPAYARFNLLEVIYKYTLGLPRLIVNAIKGEPDEIAVPCSDGDARPVVDSYTRTEYLVSKRLAKCLKMTVERKEGYLTLSATAREPLVAAELCQAAVELLQKYVREFKLNQARASLSYIRDRYQEAKRDYIEKQVAVAQFLDSNRGTVSAKVKADRSNLTSEYEISKALFTEISKQMLQAEMKVKEDTPTLSVVRTASVPMRTANSRTKTLVIWIFAGFLMSCCLVLVKDALADRK